MKKLLLFLTLLTMSCYAFSQSYRGMFDLSAGISPSGEKKIQTPSFDVKPNIGGVFSMSHGCQITRYLFAGLGAGVCCEWVDIPKTNAVTDVYNGTLISFPVFLDLRWDLDIRRKITPFVDFKIGYQFCIEDSDNDYEFSQNGRNYSVGPKKSMYFQPTAGVRFKGGRRTGFNLGISYIPVLKRKVYDYENGLDIASFNDDLLMLNIGFDF